MKKTAVVLSITFGLHAGLSSLGMATQGQHHPWLMLRSPEVEEAGVMDTGLKPHPAIISISQTPKMASSSKSKTNDAGTRVAHRALEYRGTRYRYGGTSKRGLDCSGLVNRVWEDLKMKKIPRASKELYNSGKPVHLAELRAGDLVFFKNTYKHGISHVGVYTGNNKFVHAAGRSKGVTIAKLSDPYYQLHYAGARRLY